MEYDKRQKFEHELINRRLTWLLSSQTILFAALAIVLDKNSKDYKMFFFGIISFLGIAISLLILIGIIMGILAKYLNFKNEKIKQGKMIKQGEAKPEDFESYPLEWGVNSTITKFALFPDIFMPIVFAGAWAYLWCKLYIIF